MTEHIIKVLPEQARLRLDMFLADYSNQKDLGLSRTAVQKLIVDAKVFIDGVLADRPHLKVKAGQSIKVSIPKKLDAQNLAEQIGLDVVYEDDDIALINKPSGLVVHPAPGNLKHTLVNALLGRFKELSDINPGRPGIVHRLDKETSGLLVVAKNNPSHLKLAEQFASHTIERTYIAIVSGAVEFDENIIEAPIGRHPLKRKKMAVSFNEDTKYAKTHYRTLKRGKDFSLLELKPFTGRTHQLRVHLAFLGYPILGDEKYGRRNEFSRLALHAKSLGFTHPRTGKFLQFDSKLPEEFNDFVKKNM
ncbi:MAG: RluA family pseudouridine synthase [Candidatus Omnitrophota bacterium]